MSDTAEHLSFSTWRKRVAAFLVDAILLTGVSVVVALAMGVSIGDQFTADGGDLGADAALVVLAGYVSIALYMVPTMVLTNGQTVGKRILRLRVVRRDGQPMNATRAGWREIVVKSAIWQVFALSPVAGAVAPLLLAALDGFWPLLDGENRAIHDILAGTYVVDTG